jgi:hypothetical protein
MVSIDIYPPEYFEILHILIPRYLRVISEAEGSQLAGDSDEAFSKLQDKLGDNRNLLCKVKWFHSTDFFSLPGYVSINNLDPLSIGLFSFDIASACAVNALGINSDGDKSPNILDLCCCPGGKSQMIFDRLGGRILNNSEAHGLLVGVDISSSRLQVCKALLDKTARHKMFSLQKKSDIKINPPRQLLFHCDGTTFGLEGLGSLVFDSKVQDEELGSMFEKEKRGMNIYTYVCIFVYIFIYVCTYLCIYKYMHTSMYIFVHTYIYKYIYRNGHQSTEEREQ